LGQNEALATDTAATFNSADAAAILLIGYEDTSVDESMDGYTGATSRNPAEDMVTYILSE